MASDRCCDDRIELKFVAVDDTQTIDAFKAKLCNVLLRLTIDGTTERIERTVDKYMV